MTDVPDETEERIHAHFDRIRSELKEQGVDVDDDPTLEDALDGLMNASAYADEIGEHELAREIADCYQKLGETIVK